jgi:hypothetical protein
MEEKNSIRASSGSDLLTSEDTSLSNESINNAATRITMGKEENFWPRLSSNNFPVILVEFYSTPSAKLLVVTLM